MACSSHLAEHGALDSATSTRNASGFDDALAPRGDRRQRRATALRDRPLRARRRGASSNVRAHAAQVVTLFSQGVNQSAQGTDKVNAIINCHLATGRIGKPGAGPFSLTGQPNAMGGREVGGLANQLAAHMDFDAARHRAACGGSGRRRASPPMQGLKAVELFEAIHDGEIKALWMMAHQPRGQSLPDADFVREALKKLELFVVSENVLANDTSMPVRTCCCPRSPGARSRAP